MKQEAPCRKHLVSIFTTTADKFHTNLAAFAADTTLEFGIL